MLRSMGDPVGTELGKPHQISSQSKPFARDPTELTMSERGVPHRIALDRIGFVGRDLHRPECVVSGSDGTLYVSDWRGGITAIQADGGQTLIAPPTPVDGITLKPNGFDRLADGSFLIAHLDETVGGVFHMAPDGATRPYLTTIDGRDLPPTNFVLRDGWDRTWITVSTWHVPRHPVRLPGRGDGFIVLVDERGARIVADGLGFTNELRLDAEGRHLYVIEAFGRRLTRFRLSATSGLVERITDFGPRNSPMASPSTAPTTSGSPACSATGC
jgi:sugar lactone lactonase YvrE